MREPYQVAAAARGYHCEVHATRGLLIVGAPLCAGGGSELEFYIRENAEPRRECT